MTSDADVAAVRVLLEREPDVVVALPDGKRSIAADLEGEPGGVPVVLVHGTPDSRLARHPDPGIVASLGVRLVALDRPGFGHSTPDATTTPTRFAADVEVLLDELGVGTFHLLAWSAGTIWAAGVAATLGDRVASLTAVGGLVPREAFEDRELRAAAGAARIGMIDTAAELGAERAAEMIAPLLVPDPATPEAALEHRAESGDPDIAAIAGADIAMAAACCDAVRQGPEGLLRDVTVQFTDSGIDFGAVGVPALFLTGVDDTTCPPAFAGWYARRIPGATSRIVDGAGHGLLLTHWRSVLSEIVAR